VAQDLVDDDFQAQFVGFVDNLVEVVQIAEDRVYIAIIGYVVTEVGHGRLEERRNPDGIHAKGFHIRELLADTLQIADAVAVGVTEAAGVNLVNDAIAPPLPVVINGVTAHTLSPFRDAY